MFPIYHIIYGAIFSLLIYIFFPSIGLFGLSIIFLSSVLIDIDHYLYYVFRKKDFNLKRAFKWFVKFGKKFRSLPKEKQRKVRIPLCIFHGFESLLVLFILSYFSEVFYFIFFGFAIHLFFDFIGALYEDVRFHNFSAIYKFIKTRNFPDTESI